MLWKANLKLPNIQVFQHSIFNINLHIFFHLFQNFFNFRFGIKELFTAKCQQFGGSFNFYRKIIDIQFIRFNLPNNVFKFGKCFFIRNIVFSWHTGYFLSVTLLFIFPFRKSVSIWSFISSSLPDLITFPCFMVME